ncbi:MAG: N-6 DNA methylase [Anaerolineae bacterium]|nr:N-6 DNA methylase [Anaerolineae bacterium]
MTDKTRTFGQFETPTDVADLLLAFCLRRASDRVLDPSCGRGAMLARVLGWQTWLANVAAATPGPLHGVELDLEAAATARARLPAAHILQQNFFTLHPADLAGDCPFDVIVGNPPYTRAQWIARLQQESAEQLAMFAPPEDGAHAGPDHSRTPIIPPHLWNRYVDRRAGLHTYFLLHGLSFLREGGRFGFVLPNNWLDVAYGEGLKQFLLDHFRIVALVESNAERWFSQARVNTCLLVLERCSDPAGRAANRVRFVQLRRPLERLLPPSHDDSARYDALERLVVRVLAPQDLNSGPLRVRVVPQRELHAREKWGVIWRAPAAFLHARREARRRRLVPLSEWARVRRGFTTGANDFFYLDAGTIATWGIEPDFRRPLLKSLRHVDGLEVPAGASEHQVLLIPPTASIAGTAAARYLAWGEQTGVAQRSTCARRHPWYVLPLQEPAPLVLPKGIWDRHLVPLLSRETLVDQQLYQIQLQPGVASLVAAALLNSSWTALQLELVGRINFGEGVLWLANYEVEKLLLPDPRYLTPAETARLVTLFRAVAAQPLAAELTVEMARPERQALDEAVAALCGLSNSEGQEVREMLFERVTIRHRRARSRRRLPQR